VIVVSDTNNSVFICYASSDRDKADKIRNMLMERNVDVWMAPYSISAGSVWSDEIPRGIQKCKYFIIVLSEKSVSSSHVKNELTNAFSKNKTIFPVKIEEVKLIDTFDYYLSSIQIINGIDDVQQAVCEILDQIFCDESVDKNQEKNIPQYECEENEIDQSDTELPNLLKEQKTAKLKELKELKAELREKTIECQNRKKNIMARVDYKHKENNTRITDFKLQSLLECDIMENWADHFEISDCFKEIDVINGALDRNLNDVEKERWDSEKQELSDLFYNEMEIIKDDYRKREQYINNSRGPGIFGQIGKIIRSILQEYDKVTEKSDAKIDFNFSKEETTKYFSKSKLRIIYLVDTSGSMAGKNIEAINSALNSIVVTNPKEKIITDIIGYDSNISLFQSVQNKNIELHAEGMTFFGGAIKCLIRMMNSVFVNDFNYVFVFISDGFPNDYYEDALNEMKQKKWYGESLKVSVPIGDDADKELLESISNRCFTYNKEINDLSLKSLIEKINDSIVTHFLSTNKENSGRSQDLTFEEVDDWGKW